MHKKRALSIFLALCVFAIFLFIVQPGDKLDNGIKNQKEQIAYMLNHMENDHLHTWDYQDVDYELLAAIISKQTNLSYNAYIQTNFAKPLKLHKIKDFSEVKQSEVPQPMNKNVD